MEPSDQLRSLETITVPSLPHSVAQVRRFAVGVCQEQGFGDSCDTMALLVSEVATNALIHGSGDVRVRVARNGDLLRVEVADDSDAEPVPRQAGPDAEGGRGMTLVEAMSVQWGVHPASPHGKVVWFDICA